MAFEELTTRHAQVWGSAPFERIAGIITEMHVALVERLAPQPGERWLDLGCGTGDVAFHAAQAGAIVTGSDLSPALIETAQRRAGELGLDLTLEVADAQALHYADVSFDVVSSSVGVIFAPVAWLMGVSWKDASTIGNLLGTRLVLNEFVAFLQLAPLKAQLDPRSFVIATYALCGFANLSSIAIQIGGIGALAPERRGDLARLGLRAMAAGAMVSFITGSIAGILIGNAERPEAPPAPAPQARAAVVADSGPAQFVFEDALVR